LEDIGMEQRDGTCYANNEERADNKLFGNEIMDKEESGVLTGDDNYSHHTSTLSK
jgi:hypothetical protein